MFTESSSGSVSLLWLFTSAGRRFGRRRDGGSGWGRDEGVAADVHGLLASRIRLVCGRGSSVLFPYGVGDLHWPPF